jgi:hypothetical protein
LSPTLFIGHSVKEIKHDIALRGQQKGWQRVMLWLVINHSTFVVQQKGWAAGHAVK